MRKKHKYVNLRPSEIYCSQDNYLLILRLNFRNEDRPINLANN